MSPYFPPTRIQGPGPEDSGFFAWNFDIGAAAGTGSNPMTPAGTIFVQRLWLDRPRLVTNICCHVQTAGATLTAGSCLAAAWNASGTLLATSVNQATAWTTTGFKAMALTAATTFPAGWIDVGWWYTGTTGPAMVRGTSYAGVNGSQSGASLRAATANTGQTTAAPATLGTKTASVSNYWAALS